MDTVNTTELLTPVFHETCTFAYIDDDGDLIVALGKAEYFDDFTVLSHIGGKTVADDLYSHEIVDLRFGGEPFRLRHFSPSKSGSPRFLIPKGYDFFYGEG